MKNKVIFLSLFGLFFLVGCSSTDTNTSINENSFVSSSLSEEEIYEEKVSERLNSLINNNYTINYTSPFQSGQYEYLVDGKKCRVNYSNFRDNSNDISPTYYFELLNDEYTVYIDFGESTSWKRVQFERDVIRYYKTKEVDDKLSIFGIENILDYKLYFYRDGYNSQIGTSNNTSYDISLTDNGIKLTSCMYPECVIDISNIGCTQVILPTNVEPYVYYNDLIESYVNNIYPFNDSIDETIEEMLSEDSNYYEINFSGDKYIGIDINYILDAYNKAKENKDIDENSKKLYELLGGVKFSLTPPIKQRLDAGEDVYFDIDYFTDDCKYDVAYFVLLEGLDSFITLYKPSTDFYKKLSHLNSLYSDKSSIYNYNNSARKEWDGTFLYENQLLDIYENASKWYHSEGTYFSTINNFMFQELAVFADSLDCKIEDNNYLNIANYDSTKNMYANIMDYLNAQGYSKYGYTIEDSRKSEVFKTNDFNEFIDEFESYFTEEKSYSTNYEGGTFIISFGTYIIKVTAIKDVDKYKNEFRNMLLVLQKSLSYTEHIDIFAEYVYKFIDIPCSFKRVKNEIEYIYDFTDSSTFKKWTIPEYEAEFGPITDTYDFSDD
ncbi:MAG: hypothetical protein IJS83_00570 [Acholeplasmatales bacterium]|nr:hypothetical protein [Acholeplasmatales bacterium]